ncbi:hypothetical protein BH11PAT4_BH11PAT4_5870 [soil metagenome]
MFPKRQRLHTTNDILTVFRRGEVIRNGPLRIHNTPSGDARVTVIVDKKVSKLAVERNLVKRRLRAILATHPLPSGSTIVRGFSGIETMTYEQLSESLLFCLKKLSKK